MGGAGEVIFFVTTYVTALMSGWLLLAYTAYCFFVVVDDTIAGLDEVVWPGEAFGEWLGRAAVLAWLVLVWLAPLGMFLRVSAPGLFRDDPEIVLLAGGVVLWLFFPVGVLSSLAGGSRWAFFRPKILPGLARVAPTALGFYVVTALLIAGTLALWYVAFTRSGLLILGASAVGAASLLIYARLLGRVAWRLNRLRPRKRRGSPSQKKDEAPPLRSLAVEDPWAGPPRKRKKRKPSPEPVTETPEVYRLSTDEPIAPPPVEVPLDGYAPVDEPLPPLPPPDLPEESNLDKRLAERTPQATVPACLLFSGVYTFPFYVKTLKAWLWLTLGGAFTGGIISLLKLPS
ncbi:MAG: hypothetical protein HYS12_05255 [Planctomycetes bacterium]|nr:hypothetical protein [Planctomycetota bacterium]